MSTLHDWTCPSCGASVFASKEEGFKCGTPNPDDNPEKREYVQAATAWSGGAAKVLPTRLERSTAEYLRRLEVMMYNNALSSEEEWRSMLSTAFEEVGGGTEYSVCGDVVGSRVIERLMSQAIEHGMPELVVEHYCALLTPERYWNIFGDKYGSHVAQTLFDLLRRVLAAQGERRLGDALRHRVVQRTLELAA
eukprot:COSAG01_NODE_26792_length_703_cov_1.016556_1_plen_192_part_01